MRKKRLRFSIRMLLLVPVVVAALSWYASLPSMRARQFVNAVRNGQPAVARNMLTSTHLNSTHQAAIEGDYDMHVTPVSFSSLWNGETLVFVHVPEPFGMPGGTWIRFKRNDIEVSPSTW